jgi:hypothetical protein
VSYRLPQYYFQDIHPDVMDEIMRGMQAALPEPSWEEIDHWLNTHNIASTIPDWYDRAGEFTSDGKICGFFLLWCRLNLAPTNLRLRGAGNGGHRRLD